MRWRPLRANALMGMVAACTIAIMSFTFDVYHRAADANGYPADVERVLVRRERGALQTKFGAGLSHRDYLAIARQSESFAVVGASADFPCEMGRSGVRVAERCGFVSGDFFRTVRPAAILGRPLRAEDDDDQAPRRAVVSATFWRRFLEADPRIVGKEIVADGGRYTIVGVTSLSRSPKGDDVGVWLPLHNVSLLPNGLMLLSSGTASWLDVVATRKPHVAESDAATGAARAVTGTALGVDRLDDFPSVRFAGVTDAAGTTTDLVQRHILIPAILLILFAVIAAIVNARRSLITSRHHDDVTGVTSLSRGSHLVSETAAALLAASASSLVLLSSADHFLLTYHSLRAEVLAALISAVLAGALLYSVRLRLSKRGPGTARSSSALMSPSLAVYTQVAVASVVTLLCVSSIVRFRHLEDGAVVSPLRESLGLITVALPTDWDATRRSAYIDRALLTLRRVQFVRSVALLRDNPFGAPEQRLVFAGQELGSAGARANVRYVSASYFQTLDQPLLHGRAYPDDGATSVSGEAIVDTRFIEATAAGAQRVPCVRNASDAEPPLCVPVRGVVGSTNLSSPTLAESPTIFLPWTTAPSSRVVYLLTRTAVPFADAAGLVSQSMTQLLPGTNHVNIQPVDRLVASALRPIAFQMYLALATGIVILLIAIGGLRSLTAPLSTETLQSRSESVMKHETVLLGVSSAAVMLTALMSRLAGSELLTSALTPMTLVLSAIALAVLWHLTIVLGRSRRATLPVTGNTLGNDA